MIHKKRRRKRQKILHPTRSSVNMNLWNQHPLEMSTLTFKTLNLSSSRQKRRLFQLTP